MKVCIVGAGAIGGLIGAKLALAGGAQVSVLARGQTLAAVREHGLRIAEDDAGARWRSAPVRASDDAAALGAQDLIIIAVKAPALPQLAQRLRPLLDAATVVLPAMNGVPWWFGKGLPAIGALPLESVDPRGRISQSIPLEHVLGCVVHLHAARPAPGCVAGVRGRSLIIGEPQSASSARVGQVAALLRGAGFDVVESSNIRRELWYKLWGNLTINPISAVTGATADRILADPLVRDFCSSVMREAAQLGSHIGCEIEQTVEDRHAITAKLGAFKTSMLQDVEAGRPVEIDAIVAAVSEIGARLAIPTPHIDALLGMARLFARVRCLYPEADQPGAGG
ncbi:2-dehydropantoate 2-reductase [Aquabacterium sp.]|uniref:2-dehydropantoate 2-reductase n=1 Tax=Aquabacterium sp. TaxID=1872578 RepID=UPI002BD10203|nr:2-dehydropantoate 2-reductase [Aquabacterium sp.]HSW05202.1 2-dehydropantoate 2-reductase [Aquabacterium sp.]